MDDTAKHAPEHQHRRLRVYTLTFHAAWICIVAFAAWRRFSLPFEPLADRDVWGFLSPALNKLAGNPFVQSEGRAFVYPGFVYLLLSAFHSLGAVTIAQHLLGLATGVLMLANWRIARRLLPRPLVPAVLHDLVGLALLAVFLLCAQSILAEHHLRPEGVLPFFTMLGLNFTIRFLLAKNLEARPRHTFYFGALSLATALLLPLFKPSYSLTAILTTIPIWWHLFDRREKWSSRLAMIGIPVLAAWLFLWIPEGIYASGDPRAQTFLPASLFTIHATQIRSQMALDLEHASPEVPYSHQELQAIADLLDKEIETSRPTVRHGFASLGFNPDYLLYEDSFCRKLVNVLPQRSQRADFYRFYFRRTWKEQPRLMSRKVASQMGVFYNLDCPVYEQKITALDRNYRDTYAVLTDSSRFPLVSRVPAVAQYVAALPHLAETHTLPTQPKAFKTILPFFARSYLPGLLLGLAAMAWMIAESDIRAACGWFAAVVALGYLYNLGNNVSIALFHTLGIGRYAHVQLVTTLLTQGLSLWLVIEVAARKFARPRGEEEEPGGKRSASSGTPGGRSLSELQRFR